MMASPSFCSLLPPLSPPTSYKTTVYANFVRAYTCRRAWRREERRRRQLREMRGASLMRRPRLSEKDDNQLPSFLSLPHHQYTALYLDDGRHDEKTERRLGGRRRREGLWVFALFVLATLALSAYFRSFSTLYPYLVWLLLVVPVELVCLARIWFAQHYSTQHRQSMPSAHWHPSRIVALSIGLLLWTWVALMYDEDVDGMNGSTNAATTYPVGPVFIAVNLYNSANIFPQFGTSMIDLIDSLGGPGHAFVSIYESNSNDQGRTIDSLLDFRQQLNDHRIAHDIVYSTSNDTNPVSRLDHVQTGDGVRRMEMLSRIRNEALQPLFTHEAERYVRGRQFDKVLWLNDVFFDPAEALQLLRTNDGQYDVACAFDYTALGLYDTWVTRDLEGLRPKLLWPFFSSQRDVDRLRRKEPILVNSCWNGAAAFDARWFSGHDAPLKRGREAVSTKNNATSHQNNSLPIRFRTDQCLASECLLINLDIHRALGPDVRPIILMNPNVVTTYDRHTFHMYHDVMRWPVVRPWHIVWESFVSAWLFKRLTDVGRSQDWCWSAFHSEWSQSFRVGGVGGGAGGHSSDGRRIDESSDYLLSHITAARWHS